MSHLHIACVVNHTQAVEFFAKAKESLDQQINSDSNWLPGYTALHCAIECSSVEAAEILLQHGANVHVKNAKGLSSVHLLVEHLMDIAEFITMAKRALCMPFEKERERLESIITLMLKSSDEIFVDDTGLPSLHLACTLRGESTVQSFLKKGVDVNVPIKNESKFCPGWKPLHFAACFNVEMMVLLIQSGANVMMKNLKGETALDLCVKRFAPADIRLILSMGNEFKDIVLSDNCTKLSDLLIAMSDSNDFSDFLKELKDVNTIIPLNSPIWPGYNLLHLAVCLNEKTKWRKLWTGRLDSRESKDVIERYNCTEDEETLYGKRIELCLEYGCSVSMENAYGQTPVHLAFGMRRRTAVEQLLKCSIENIVDPDGLSHLHIACVAGHVDAVKRYVSGGADVTSRAGSRFEWRDKHDSKKLKKVRANSTPLHLAVVFGYEDVVEYLLANDADVYAQDSMGFTPIHLTMYAHRPVSEELARILFRATPNLRDSVSRVGLSHLHVAARTNDQEAVDRLLLNGAEVDRVVDADAREPPFVARFAGKTALLVAAERSVKSLLKAGADVYAEDPEGISALRHALREMSDASATHFMRMVKRGRCEVESCGLTLLHVACGKCDFDWAKKLLKKGADVNARIRDGDKNRLEGATPLHVLLDVAGLVGYNYHELVNFVELLVDSGADLTIECRGSTPLHRIYEQCYYDAFDDEDFYGVEFFLRAADVLLARYKSCDVDPVNYQGFSHFHLTCLRDDVETARKFLDHGADVNASIDPFAYYNGGFTSLHFAMAYGCEEVAHLLLERGADVNAEDVWGNKPLHVAMKTQFVDLPLIRSMLSDSLGADIHAKNVNDESLLYCLLKFGGPTVDNYLETIQLSMDYGCDLNQEDKAEAPINEAVHFYNLQAINALLKLGADANAIDIAKGFALDELTLTDERKMNVAKALACHVWKMRLTQLHVKNSNLRWLESVEEHLSLVTLLEQSCKDELTKIKQTAICEGLTVRDFLSELRAVVDYPRMCRTQRAAVDKYFKRTADLRCEFPEFCGLLASQYRKALNKKARLEMWQPAKEAIMSICQVELPDLCLDAILRYFTNSEMKLVIELVAELI